MMFDLKKIFDALCVFNYYWTRNTSNTRCTLTSGCLLHRGHQELLGGRLYRPDSEQRPLVSKFTTVAIVKLCCHNFTQIANFMIFLCLVFLIDLLTYPY